MDFTYENLVKDDKFEKRIQITCAMNMAKCEFLQGKIIKLNNTNVSFIEPHRIIIKIKSSKILILYFNKENMFFYDRTMPIDIKTLGQILKEMKGMVS